MDIEYQLLGLRKKWNVYLYLSWPKFNFYLSGTDQRLVEVDYEGLCGLDKEHFWLVWILGVHHLVQGSQVPYTETVFSVVFLHNLFFEI